MSDIATALIAAGAALGGVFTSVGTDVFRDRRRLRSEKGARDEERHAAVVDRRRTFELENLLAAYDAMWLLARETVKIHAVDSRAPAEVGYGGTRLPPGVSPDIEVAGQAVKALRLILDDETRTTVVYAREAMTHVQMLGTRAHTLGTGPVGFGEGDQAFLVATEATEIAMTRIAERIRELFAQG